MPVLEQLGDDVGSVIFGWLDARVFYARFSDVITVDLSRRVAERFDILLGGTDAVRYFCDYGRLEAYDVGAFTPIFDVLFAKRGQFQLITMLTWLAAPRSNVRTLLDSLGCIELVPSAAAFEARLRAVAPTTNIGAAIDLIGASAPPGDREAPPAPPAMPKAALPETTALSYTYVFELGDFERGSFTATRHTHLSARPRGAWVCVARDDEQALALAREAALLEWAPPTSRHPQAFSVRFVEAPPAPHRRR